MGAIKVAVIGSGYVGLVAAACFADAGHEVECVDIDSAKIEALRAGRVPFFEPGLEALVRRVSARRALRLSVDVAGACARAAVILIAVGTPQGDDGSAELRFVYSVASTIGEALAGEEAGGSEEGLKVVLTKSTVPIGTTDEVSARIAARARHPFVVCSNPEFLKEGDALNDFLKPDRVILGVPSDARGAAAERVARRLYASFCRTHDRMQVMDVRSSELTKYAANALLATKISFMNELSRLAEAVGADIERVRVGVGADPRIGYSFLFAGAGYGGSCFPKDVRALQRTAERAGVSAQILGAVDAVNEQQKLRLFERARQHFAPYGGLAGRVFAVWGLSFKPRTDDLREAPSVTLIRALLDAGARVSAYDPEAMGVAAEVFAAEIAGGRVRLSRDPAGEGLYECLVGASALCVVTEWKEFHHPDLSRLRAALSAPAPEGALPPPPRPVIFDGRNLYDPLELQAAGFDYYGVGRGLSSAPLRA